MTLLLFHVKSGKSLAIWTGRTRSKCKLVGRCRGLPTSLTSSPGPCKILYLSLIKQNIAAFFVFLWSQHVPPFFGSKIKNCAFPFCKPGIQRIGPAFPRPHVALCLRHRVLRHRGNGPGFIAKGCCEGHIRVFTTVVYILKIKEENPPKKPCRKKGWTKNSEKFSRRRAQDVFFQG